MAVAPDDDDARAVLAGLTKVAWRKGYRAAVEGCSSDGARARVQSLYRALMTGRELDAARADAAALVEPESGADAAVLRAGVGKQAHTLARLARAMFALDEGRPLDAVEQLDWALLTGMDAELVRVLERVDSARAAGANAGADEPETEERVVVPTPDVDAARRRLDLRAADELERVPAERLCVAEFASGHFATGTPVLVAGAARGWPALDKWVDVRYFVRACGHRIIPVEIGRSALKAGDGWREAGMRMRDFVAGHLLPSCAADLADRPLPAGSIGYCAQHQLFEHVRALAADISVPVYCAAARGGVQLVNCWLGTRETATPLHFDSYDNCLVQVVGLKLVRLYGKDQTPRLYAGVPNARAPAGADVDGGVGAQGNVSAVDVDAPDLGRFPLFARAEGRWCLLAPGDLLFIPAGCWHHVRSLSTSCSVNFWF
ncbi:hypothetical protein KFE25_001396 [Diacronema lutheri]|uniref:JmjC domain-containing protein n=2 Tax=Diacronema lutheri TaxID=2081491 RepID=A0A8J5X8I5_DIALT|nr:hypothetical protein KFE25_001396 [Diacronema lutheri]